MLGNRINAIHLLVIRKLLGKKSYIILIGNACLRHCDLLKYRTDLFTIIIIIVVVVVAIIIIVSCWIFSRWKFLEAYVSALMAVSFYLFILKTTFLNKKG